MRKIDSQKKLQMLRLTAKNVRVCLPISFVSKILPLMMLEAVPGSPFYVIGLMNHAGKSIPVIDLAARLGMERDQPYSLDTPILLCTDKERELAFLADRVLGLADVSEDSVQLSDQFDPASSPFLGSVAVDNELYLLLNADCLLNFRLSSKKQDEVSRFNLAEASRYEYEND